jgi:hypothetical protein
MIIFRAMVPRLLLFRSGRLPRRRGGWFEHTQGHCTAHNNSYAVGFGGSASAYKPGYVVKGHESL